MDCFWRKQMKIDEILYCPGILVSSICLGQADILSKAFHKIKNTMSIENIHGLVTININIDKSKYVAGCLYSVNQSGFKIHDIRKTSNCLAITNKVFGAKQSHIDNCIEDLSIEPFSSNTSFLKTSYKCISVEPKNCILVTKLSREYSLAYLLLSLECSEKSIIVKTTSIIDDIVNYTINPLMEFIVDQCIKERISKNTCIEIVDSIDRNFLIYITELIRINVIKIPSDIEFSDIINYVKSIIKKW